ncbi:MAG: hypothetical protein V7K25_25020, partial [Nostoc sp.]|uniref:hypothetical protein n=1 Tax=Nostoc sp. TaxID=1180 RepID=UPI002FF48325
LSCTRLNKSSTFKKLVCQLLLLYLITAVSAVYLPPGYAVPPCEGGTNYVYLHTEVVLDVVRLS